MKKFMNVLLVNDDGYQSEGILITRKLLKKYAERIVIVAPKEHMSGKGSSITIGKEFEFKEVEKDYFCVDGTPVDCALFGIAGLGIDFDLVVSGANNGENLSYDLVYSGTIGAGLEGLKMGKKSIAFSCPYSFEEYKKHFDEIMDFILEFDLLSNKYLLSVNIPVGQIDGIRITKDAFREDRHYFKIDGNKALTLRDINENYSSDRDDWYAYNHHLVSITPLKNSCFDEHAFKEILEKIEK